MTEQECVEATYVDDAAVAFVASSPTALDKAIDIVLEVFIRIFGLFQPYY